MSFYKLGISGDLVYALDLQNIFEPTPIQSMSIPPILQGKDLIGEAQTGTGKTLAFLLPLFEQLSADTPRTQALIIAPTRELALQITEVAQSLAEIKPTGLLAAYGGQDINAQLHKLSGNIQVVIGTPGRILDHLRRGSLDVSRLNTLVVDEADQMFHIGFQKEVDQIISFLPASRQTLCFSATLSHTVDTFSKKYLNDPVMVAAPREQITLDNIQQVAVVTDNRRKYSDFSKILAECTPKKAIVFCRTRKATQALYEVMLESGHKVACIHGALTQAKRESVMADFKAGKLTYMVATDVAARGLDVSGVTHVFNYSLPDEPEVYVHRIGRTGRAGKEGSAYTILTKGDKRRLADIEVYIDMQIERKRVSSGEAQPAPSHEIKKDAVATKIIQANERKRKELKNTTRPPRSGQSSSGSRRPSRKPDRNRQGRS